MPQCCASCGNIQLSIWAWGWGQSDELLVAAGTIFLDIVIWKTPCSMRADAGPLACPPLYHLKGHEGSIHRQAYSILPSLYASMPLFSFSFLPPPPFFWVCGLGGGGATLESVRIYVRRTVVASNCIVLISIGTLV